MGSTRRRALFGIAIGILLVLGLLGSSVASAAEAPAWAITSVSDPTNVAPGSEALLVVTATNTGGAAMDGSQIAISDTVPEGLSVTSVTARDSYTEVLPTCTGTVTVICRDSVPMLPGDTVVVTVHVQAEANLSVPSLLNQVSVSGGGAVGISRSNPVVISSTPATGAAFAPGSTMTAVSTHQAGAHPNVTTQFYVKTRSMGRSVNELKDTVVEAPPGLVGTTVGVPQCDMSRVAEYFISFGTTPTCPSDTIVGMATFLLGTELERITWISPVFNIKPSPGEPAAFAFSATMFSVRLDTSVRSNGDYGVNVSVPDLTEASTILSTSLTLWGVPADYEAPGPIIGRNLGTPPVTLGSPSSSNSRVPFLTNPQSCGEQTTSSVIMDSWPEQGTFAPNPGPVGTFTGCSRLAFRTGLSMLPDTLQAGAPAGYTFDLHVPQNKEPDGLATPNVKNVTVALPVGTVISPSSATGLSVCSDAQFELHSGAPGHCPRESQVGTVEIKSPALAEPLNGQVFLGAPLCDPCTPGQAQDGHMIRLLLQVVAEGENGVIVKLEGRGSINQQTGQITARFENNPQLPFDELKLTLGGGPRATLANPRTCGVATSAADITPWSTPYTPDSTPTSSFTVTGCSQPQFDPAFTAGSTNNQAGSFSPFTVSFGRTDSDEDLAGLQITFPPGLLGSVASVPLCHEPQASSGECGEESLIGHTLVQTGPGGEPFLVTGGKVFLTDGYKGAPYGLSILVPAKAGPYTLSGTTGKGTVVVRAAINVDPTTSALTITSDPLPTILDGIPLQLKTVNVTIDRPGFTFNPTSCNKLAIGATLSSAEGASASASSPFQVTNCAALGFKPGFAVSTSGKTSKANGASLDAKLTYPKGAQGNEANIAKVKVDLPKQLPSRLTTLQKACLAAVFAANPANCPAGSTIGIAKASTPILPEALTGPVYFVSHGGEAFPDLEVVLQGSGVRVDLRASTFISKAGITSSTFKQVPDVPISSFELYLPQGKNSALAAYGNLCTSKLAMPTLFIAQNGAEIHESTKIAVTGCSKAKPTKKKAAKARRARHGRSATNAHVNRRRGN
ncbi:MAG: hypothetical protein ACYDHN_04880 [Solirubrobacteraceae bacterium]